jgi:hypothetical protein
MQSLTQQAIEYMQSEGVSAYKAAKHFGITPATVYAAAKRPKCPCCGGYLKQGQIVQSLPVFGTKPEPESLLEV